MGWGPGPAKGGQNFQNMPCLWRHLQKPLPPKPKHFIFDFDYKTCWIRKGFEQLSTSIAWQVMGLQSSAKKVSRTGLKGFLNRLGGLTSNKLLTKMCFNSFWKWKFLYLILHKKFNFLMKLWIVQHQDQAHGRSQGGKRAFPPWKLGLRSKNFLKTRNHKFNSDYLG